MTRSRLSTGSVPPAVAAWAVIALATWAMTDPRDRAARAQESRETKTSQKNTKDSGKPMAPALKLIEGERVKPDNVMIMVKSTLIEEGEAVERLRADEAHFNNVRYNINTYPIGYSVDFDKQDDTFVFTGPTKGWRAPTTSDVSIWPPFAFTATRRESMRQARLLDPIPLAETCDEMNHLRVYHRPLLVDHDGEKYREEPSALVFFIHPQSGKRMTVLHRNDRSYASIGEPIVASAKVFIKDVGRGRDGSTLVPTVFYSKEVSLALEPLSQADELNRLMHAVLAAHSRGPLAAADFKALFHELSRHTGGTAEPTRRSANGSTQGK